MKTKYIFLDIDGTLVDFDCTMPDSTLTALIEAQKRGHKLLISTGRYLGQIYPWLLKAVNFDGMVMSSGANIYFGGKQIYRKYFSREQLLYLDGKFKEAGACSCRQLENCLVSSEDDYAHMCSMLQSAGVSRESAESLLGDVVSGDMCALDNVEKAIYYDSKLDILDMRKLLGPEYNIDPFSFKDMPSSCGEVNIAGINKAHGMKMVVDLLGGSMEDTIAVGDSGNDITMIRAAGVGVAMGNATDEIKAAADMITDDIDKDGVYNAFVKLGII